MQVFELKDLAALACGTRYKLMARRVESDADEGKDGEEKDRL